MHASDAFFGDIDKSISSIPNYEKLFGQRIAVSGASGLIGAAIMDILLRLNMRDKANISIIALGRNKNAMEKRFSYAGNDGYIFIAHDFLENDALKIEADYFVHCAGICSPKLYISSPVETIMGNISGLNSVLNCAKDGKIKRVLYISSSEVYGIKSNAIPFEESEHGEINILDSRSCYPCAKSLCENLCISYANEYGVDVVIGRPGHIYGACTSVNDDRAYAQFFRKALARENVVLKSAGDQIRSYCYSLDCGSALLTILCNGSCGQAYNISNHNSIVSIREFAQEICNVAGTRLIFANPTDEEKKSFNKMNTSALDATKLEGLGWTGKFDIHEGVKASLQWTSELLC